jgi:cysteinyl-tRNA synthetase
MLNFTFTALEQASAALQRIKDFWQILQESSFPEGEQDDLAAAVKQAEEGFLQALGDDLNISAALSSLFGLIKTGNVLINQGKLRAGDVRKLIPCLKGFDSVLAILPEDEKQSLSTEIDDKIRAREQARKDKDYVLADRIRDELLSQGVVLEDTKDGVRWKLKKP